MSDLQIFEYEQGSPEWHEARRGVPTASCFADILAKGRGLTRSKYLRTLVGELLTGEVSESYSTEHMQRGRIMESEARIRYAFDRDADPQRIGFMYRKSVGAGCSPDSLLDNDGMLEIKTKLAHLQIEVLERGVLPPEHIAQVQGQLWISGRAWCDFVSYWPNLPMFITRVTRDEPYIKELAQAVAGFIVERDALVSKYSTHRKAA